MSATAAIQCYRKYHILIQEFRNCFGNNIELMKSSFIFCSVILNYVLVHWHQKFNVLTITPLLTCCFIVQTNPPFLYSHAFEVYDKSVYIKRILSTWKGRTRSTVSERKYIRKSVWALYPLKIKVAGMYFLDRTMVPVFFHIVITYTLSLLILMQS